MPIYAFECGSCGHQFDRLQRLSDADPTSCPQCSAAQVRRQLTAPSFRLAGAGWYETDFKKDGDTKRNLVDKTDSVPSVAAKTENKSDTKKVEAKPESKPSAPTAPPASTTL